MIAVFTIGFLASLAVSLPNDWARRQTNQVTRGLATTVNVAGMVALVTALAATSQLNSGLRVVSVAGAMVIASVAADMLATRLWGTSRA